MSWYVIVGIDEYFIYSNQWIPLVEKCSIQEKIKLGSILDKECGGGQISHVNLQGSFANENQSWEMLNYIAKSGVIYFAYNIKNFCLWRWTWFFWRYLSHLRKRSCGHIFKNCWISNTYIKLQQRKKTRIRQ